MEVARQNSVMNDGAVLRAANHEALAAARYRAERIKLWNGYVRKPATTGYYRRLAEIYRYLVPAGSRVLELGSGTGDLLAALEPSASILRRRCSSGPLRAIRNSVSCRTTSISLA
jgi:hypothetical protein